MKRLMIAVATVLLFLGLTAPTPSLAATDFKDVTDYKEEIEYLTDQEIINGYPDGTFKPAADITRIQAVHMILRAKGITDMEAPDPGFTDLDSSDEAYAAVAKAVDLGIIDGKIDFETDKSYFDPYGTLTRAQMAKVLVLTYDLEGTNGKEFTDVPEEIGFYESIMTLAANNITNGYLDGTFKPYEHLSRQHFAVFMTRTMKTHPSFDASKVMDTIRHLSVDIGPRIAGTEEEKEAAHDLQGIFDEYGYDTSIQEFAIQDTVAIQLKNLNTSETLALGAARGSGETAEGGVTGNLYDAGIGLSEDFTEDADGKIALIQRGEINYWEKVTNATNAGAIGAVIYDNKESLMPVRPNLEENESSIPVVGAEKEVGESLRSQMEEKEVEANLSVRTQTNQKSQNVIAVKKPKNVANPEIVYISGHYDSVPFSPGANDDASGTATAIELARIMKDIPTDKELRFIAFGAEEIGLVGSKHYVSELTKEEIDRSAVNFQMEMLGAAYEPASYMAVNTIDGQKNLIWDHTVDAFDTLDADQDRLILFQRGSSDHVPFHDVGITAAAFNMGTSEGGLEPEYHTPHDSIDQVSADRIQFAGDIIKTAVFDYLEDSSKYQEPEEEIEEAS